MRSPYSVEGCLPTEGRPVICRQDGCAAPATDDVAQLSEEHGWWQPKSAPGGRGPKSRPRRVDD